jgi:sugar lactone lactonase YvrE
VRYPTMPAFGGDGLDTLYVTPANRELSEEGRRRQWDESGLFALAAPVPGLAEPYIRFRDGGF